ncbi:hypothetical protein MKW94_001854 [Papaver nudicaule]|uniref:Uncharacterized protein n=1 Tax=Papaver nudicaule TaxID=74823 RepID=A0AA41VZZ3_PAPNU|nr:hypothetical protein [Papaver nudicaule]
MHQIYSHSTTPTFLQRIFFCIISVHCSMQKSSCYILPLVVHLIRGKSMSLVLLQLSFLLVFLM